MQEGKNKERMWERRNEPDADLANVANALSSNGRKTSLTTRLPSIDKMNKLSMPRHLKRQQKEKKNTERK